VNCPDGFYSFAGGKCVPCPAGFSSVAGDESCFACGPGQASIESGKCVDLCPDGMMYSRAFALCQICPQNSFSYSGDISCSRCAPGHFAPEQSAACFSEDRVGAIMRLEADYSTWKVDVFIRQMAIILDTEPEYIDIVNYRLGASGIVVVYFDILDPVYVSSSDSQIRGLSGNEKMLLVYQWWLTDDARMRDFYEFIIDFKLYSFELISEDDGDVHKDVVTLFASTDEIDPIVPKHPRQNNQHQRSDTYTRSEDTFYFTLSVGEVSSRASVLQPNVLAHFVTLFTTLALVMTYLCF